MVVIYGQYGEVVVYMNYFDLQSNLMPVRYELVDGILTDLQVFEGRR